MAIVNGNDVGLYVNNQLIGCLTGCTFTSSNEEIDVTCKDNSGARQVLAGGNTSSFSFEGKEERPALFINNLFDSGIIITGLYNYVFEDGINFIFEDGINFKFN